MRINPILTVSLLLVFAVINVGNVFSQDEDDMLEKMAADEELQQEMKWLKAETYVITASKVMETIKKAPASISVITDRQIRQMGARDLGDVLRAVPGFDTYRFHGGGFLFIARGGVRIPSNNVLIMINSLPKYDASTQEDSTFHETLIIDNIKRIEFIRGPGSALYGASAFHGVINVITKEAEDVDGFELTARGGSWDTQQYNLLYGKAFSELEVAFNFNYFKTHGHRAFIEEDYQTFLDGFFGSSASLAPGRTNGGDEKYDVTLNLKFKGFTFDGRYVDHEREAPVGIQPVLNEGSIASRENYYLNLSYETAILERLDLSGKVYRRQLVDYFFDSQLFPPGVVLPSPTPTRFATWEDGFLHETSGKTSRTGIEIQATYRIIDSNTVVVGATYEEQKWYDKSLSANYLPVPGTNLNIKLSSVQEWPDDAVAPLLGGKRKRNFKAFFLEDIWDITDDIRLTTGVRYDRYSDFGGEVSPRVGLTWEYIKGYDLKLLYGHAFRAPTFYETISPGSNLDPETIDTYEVSLGADFTSSFSGRITLFHKEEEDIIWPIGQANYANQGKARDQGFELEAKYDFGKGTYISGYYEYLSVKSGPSFSNYLAQLMANVRLSRYLNFNADCNHWDSTNRANPEDPRDDPSSLTLVNATLIAKKFLKGYEGLELRGSVYNLFDKDWSRDVPDMTPSGLPAIPNDWPIPGINYLLEMKYTF